MALELNGTTGVSLVQDGVVTAADLASTLGLTGKTVTLPAGTGGKVLQVVQGITNTEVEISSSTMQNTTLAASITPSSAASKILVLISVGDTRKSSGSSQNRAQFELRKNGSAVNIGSASYLTSGIWYTATALEMRGGFSFSYLDTAGSTSSTEYRLYFRSP